MAEPELDRHGHLRVSAQNMIDFCVVDLDFVVDFPVSQTLQRNIVTNIFTIFFKGDAALFNMMLELRHRHVLAFGDTGNRSVELGIVDTETHFLGQLHLRTFNDHMFQCLFPQDFSWWQRDILLLEPLFD